MTSALYLNGYGKSSSPVRPAFPSRTREEGGAYLPVW